MKIIHFITSIDKSSGGTTAYMQLLSKGLKDIVDLLVITGLSPNPIELNSIDTRFLDLSISRWYKLKKEIYNLLVNEKPDIVHINGIWQPQCWLFQKVAQQLEIKVILSPHGMLDPYILQRHPFKKKLALKLYQYKAVKKTDYLHATSELELCNIRRLGFNQKAVIVPNCIDIFEIKPKVIWDNKIKKILFLSRLHNQKGVELLIEAVGKIKRDDFELIIAGNGELNYLEKLKQQIVEKKIHIVGGVYGEQKWDLFQSADIFVLPSFSECFGIVVAEALATGIPVITTTGTPWQELETNRCGWWVDLNVPNLVNALNEAINKTSKELQEMGLRGRKLVEEKYEIKAVAERMFLFYTEIIKS